MLVIVFVNADELADVKRRLDSCYGKTNLRADDNQRSVVHADTRINQVCKRLRTCKSKKREMMVLFHPV